MTDFVVLKAPLVVVFACQAYLMHFVSYPHLTVEMRMAVVEKLMQVPAKCEQHVVQLEPPNRQAVNIVHSGRLAAWSLAEQEHVQEIMTLRTIAWAVYEVQVARSSVQSERCSAQVCYPAILLPANDSGTEPRLRPHGHEVL